MQSKFTQSKQAERAANLQRRRFLRGLGAGGRGPNVSLDRSSRWRNSRRCGDGDEWSAPRLGADANGLLHPPQRGRAKIIGSPSSMATNSSSIAR